MDTPWRHGAGQTRWYDSFGVAGMLCRRWETAPHMVNEAIECDVAYWPFSAFPDTPRNALSQGQTRHE